MIRGAGRRKSAHARARGPHRAALCAVVTVSDTRRGADDRGGARVAALLERAGHVVAARAWVRDEPAAIRRVVRAALGRPEMDLMVITGGTGLAPRDRTPEAIAPLIERDLPGFGEAFRTLSLEQVGSAAWMSRAGAAIVKSRLLFMLPGSIGAVDLAMRRLIVPEIAHALRTLGRWKDQE